MSKGVSRGNAPIVEPASFGQLPPHSLLKNLGWILPRVLMFPGTWVSLYEKKSRPFLLGSQSIKQGWLYGAIHYSSIHVESLEKLLTSKNRIDFLLKSQWPLIASNVQTQSRSERQVREGNPGRCELWLVGLQISYIFKRMLELGKCILESNPLR